MELSMFWNKRWFLTLCRRTLPSLDCVNARKRRTPRPAFEGSQYRPFSLRHSLEVTAPSLK
ncbi:hypothetical protein C8Q76DRAFT_757386 [Earliella scabrosa]|nr:hypothetical protein C8Q76DRAFT_757386 [Earliella scabrosa]